MGMGEGHDDNRQRRAADVDHPLLAAVAALESALESAALDSGTGVAALSAEQLQHTAQQIWELIQRLYGAALLPVTAEANQRRLFRTERYAGASSMRDLISGWLRCTPAMAGRLLYLAKHCIGGGFQETGTALAAGDIDTDHARAVVQAVRRLPPGITDAQQRDQAESTMLDTAKATDSEVTAAAGQRLLEIIAPEAAEEHADQQAERERQRAEAARWFEVTGFGLAGAKEVRLRAEAEVIDSLLRVMSGLIQGSPTDPSPPDAVPASPASHLGTVDGDQTPGSVADIGSSLQPIERRRADAAVEIIDAIARPDLLDDLTPHQLRSLADQLNNTSATAANEHGPALTQPDTDPSNDAGQLTDEMYATVVDGGQITADSCDDTTQAAIPTQRTRAPVSSATGSTAADSSKPTNARKSGRIRGERPSLIVIANYDSERGRPHAGEASSTGAPPRTASAREIERLACQALITPVWMTIQTTPVTVAAPTRYFRGKQLAALIARDRGCCFPGCSRGLRYAHAHHVLPWSEGGPTTVNNGAITCSHHHRVIHNDRDNPDGWKLHIAADGLPEFTPPSWINPTRQPQRHTRYQKLLSPAA